MFSRNVIGATSAFLLLEIQTKMPSYIVRYTLQGCNNPGFDGYPLDDNSKQGLEYIACCISSINRNDAPWNLTGFQTEKSDVKRQLGIQMFIESILKKVVSDDMIQQQLSDKRRYLSEILGADGRKGMPKDIIPASFLPEQIIISPSSAAENPIIPEVVQYMGNRGKIGLAKQWIRESHIMAQKTASLIRGSPIVETTCCLGNIQAPNTFWSSISDLPQLDNRQLVPNRQGSFLQVHFTPRPSENLLVKPDQDSYYKLFLKCCFQGPRTGYSHEPGLTNKCYWCGFQFPANPNVLDTDTEGKSALVSQNISTTSEEFTVLLDKIHEVNKVDRIKQNELSSMEAVMNEFSNLEPEPISGWKDIILDTARSFNALPKDANRGDIAQALGIISDATSDANIILSTNLKEKYINIIDSINKLSWINWYQVIQSYFITPFQRILVQFNKESLFIPSELKLSDDHKKDIQKLLDTDTVILTYFKEPFSKQQVAFARSKIKFFLKQISALIPYKNKIRSTLIPGRGATLVYIQRCLLTGPLSNLLDSSVIPEDSEVVAPIKSVTDNSLRLITTLLSATLDKYNNEKMAYNDTELKELITIRNEKEKMNIIKEFDRMTDEERAIELTKKKLGIGRWAVGGTKLIYAYDPDQYDRERIERERAGIIDFPGHGPGESDPLNGRPVDDLGFFEGGNDEYYEGEGGYDHIQTAEDDA